MPTAISTVDSITETTLTCQLCETIGRKSEIRFVKKTNSWYGMCPECLFRAYAPFTSMRVVLERVVQNARASQGPGK
jgi:hypothetical protein